MSTGALLPPAPPSVLVGGDDELYEIIDGKRVSLADNPLAAWTASHISCVLGEFVAAEKVGRVILHALFHALVPINADRRPDVAFVSYDRWPKSRSVPRHAHAWDVVPNLNVEVVSPTDSAEELQEKIEDYFRAGVELVWVVYPPQSKIHVYESPTQIRVLTAADELDGGTVLPGFRLALAELFSEPAEGDANVNGAAS